MGPAFDVHCMALGTRPTVGAIAPAEGIGGPTAMPVARGDHV